MKAKRCEIKAADFVGSGHLVAFVPAAGDIFAIVEVTSKELPSGVEFFKTNRPLKKFKLDEIVITEIQY